MFKKELNNCHSEPCKAVRPARAAARNGGEESPTRRTETLRSPALHQVQRAASIAQSDTKISVFVFIMLTLVLAACSASGSGELGVNDVWARPGLAGGNSAVFFVIDNPVADDMLLSASSDVADAVELHKTIMEDGNMKMVHQMNVPVPIGETVFKPGDLHVMLIGLKNDLKPGDTFTVTLNFETAGGRTLNVVVREP